MKNKIARILILTSLFIVVGDRVFAGKVNVEEVQWWAMIEKCEISQNKGETYFTLFENNQEILEMKDATAVEMFELKNDSIPAGTFNLFRLTMTVTKWRVIYNDGNNISAPIVPDIDDRKTYEIVGAMLATLSRDNTLDLYLQFDTSKSLRYCVANWNGISYTLEEWDFYPVAALYEKRMGEGQEEEKEQEEPEED